VLIGPSSEYARLGEDDPLAFFQRFPSIPRPRRALSAKNITQMHYARKGVITPEMEFVVLRESMRLDRLAGDAKRARATRCAEIQWVHQRMES